MPFFVECATPSIKYMRGEAVTNKPVNLDLCKSIGKSRFAWYPDNTGKPAIQFLGCDVEWVFDTESARDAEISRIVGLRAPT